MSLTIDSKEAFEIASINYKDKSDKLFDQLLIQIRKTSESGLFEYWSNSEHFNNDIKKKLEDLGFKVIVDTGSNYKIISWNK